MASLENTMLFQSVFRLARLVVFVVCSYKCPFFLRKRKADDVDGGVSKKQKKEDEKLQLKLKV